MGWFFCHSPRWSLSSKCQSLRNWQDGLRQWHRLFAKFIDNILLWYRDFRGDGPFNLASVFMKLHLADLFVGSEVLFHSKISSLSWKFISVAMHKTLNGSWPFCWIICPLKLGFCLLFFRRWLWLYRDREKFFSFLFDLSRVRKYCRLRMVFTSSTWAVRLMSLYLGWRNSSFCPNVRSFWWSTMSVNQIGWHLWVA